MSHVFTIAIDHRLQLFDIFRRHLSLHQAVQAINNRQHPENKIDTDIHNATIVTQLDDLCSEKGTEALFTMGFDRVSV